MTSESYSEMESSGMDVSAAAGYSGFGFSVGAEFSMSEKQQRQSSEFNENVETYTTSVRVSLFYFICSLILGMAYTFAGVVCLRDGGNLW